MALAAMRRQMPEGHDRCDAEIKHLRAQCHWLGQIVSRHLKVQGPDWTSDEPPKKIPLKSGPIEYGKEEVLR